MSGWLTGFLLSMSRMGFSSASSRNFRLDIEPKDKLVFAGDLTGEIRVTLKLTNNSESKQAFKVKCTRNDLFRIRPPIGILDYGESVDVSITYKCLNRQIPESDRHHFGIYHIPAPEGCSSSSAWSEHYGPPQGEFRMKVFFEDTRNSSPNTEPKGNVNENSKSSNAV